MSTQHSTLFKRALIAFCVASACIACAVFLRYSSGYAFRETITLLLGFEGRAAIEHLLTGIGVPLAVGFSFLTILLCACWASYAACNWAGWTWKPLAKHPSEVASFEHFAFHVSIWSAVYVLSAGLWEWDQAYVGVYGGAARGYIQWAHFGADVNGALIAVCIAFWVAKDRRMNEAICNAVGGCEQTVAPRAFTLARWQQTGGDQPRE